MSALSAAPLVLKRTYAHDRLRVFDAFSSASALQQWFSPAPDIGAEVVVWDFQVGGCYRITFTLPDGSRTTVRGEFDQIERPDRLSFTWCWEEPDPHAGIDTLVTIDFVNNGGATDVVVTHERLRDQEVKSRHSDGWSGALSRLDRWLGPMPRRTVQEQRR